MRCCGGQRGERVVRVAARRAEDRHDARVVAVGVVVRRHLAELREPAGEVGRVLARVRDHRLRAVERADRAREHRRWSSSARRGCLRRSARSGRCSGPAARISVAQVGDRGPQVVPRAGAARGRTARACAWRASTPRTSRSRSSSVPRRFTNVVFAFRIVPGSSSSARWSEVLSSPIAAMAWFVLTTRPARSSRRSAIARHGGGAVLQEALEHRLVERELLRQLGPLDEERSEVLGALARLGRRACRTSRRSRGSSCGGPRGSSRRAC